MAFFYSGLFRSFVADYGVPVMTILWTALSYAIPAKVPSGVPRRLESPLPWDSESARHWTVIKVYMKKPIFPVTIKMTL